MKLPLLVSALLAALTMLLLCGSAHCQDISNGYFLPDQSVKVPDVPEVHAVQRCENYALAADLEAMLRQQNAPISQDAIADKIWSGACLDSPPDLEQVKRRLEDEYILADGRRVRVEAKVMSALPSAPEPFLLPLFHGETYVLYWRNHAYLLVSVLWDETNFYGAGRIFHFRQFTLLDPFETGEKRTVTVDVAKNGLSEFGGTLQVKVTEDKPSQWVPRVKW